MTKRLGMALFLALGLGSARAQAAVVQLTDFSDLLSATILSATGKGINDAAGFTTSGQDCDNVGIGSEQGVCANEPDALLFDISSSAFEVGMLFGNDDTDFGAFFTALLSVFDGATFLGSVTVLSNGNDLVDQFIGLRSDAAFDHVELQYLDVPASSEATRLVSRVDFGLDAAPVPEPGTLALLGAGLLALGHLRRRR